MREATTQRGRALFSTGIFLCALCVLCSESAESLPWGSDHVGKPLPEYVTGDECLFCHRADVGPSWTMNRHHRSLTEADPAAPALAALKQSPSLEKYADEVKLLLGGSRQTRYLKPAKEY